MTDVGCKGTCFGTLARPKVWLYTGLLALKTEMATPDTLAAFMRYAILAVKLSAGILLPSILLMDCANDVVMITNKRSMQVQVLVGTIVKYTI